MIIGIRLSCTRSVRTKISRT